MNLLNLFELKNLLDSIPGVDYHIDGDDLIVDYHHNGSCSEFVFIFKSSEDLPF